MAIFSPLRSRRFAASKNKKVQKQVIAFLLRNEWFALPLKLFRKLYLWVMFMAILEGTGISLTIYQGKELLVVDVAHRIFSEPPSIDSTSEGDVYLPMVELANHNNAICSLWEISTEQLVGLPIDSHLQSAEFLNRILPPCLLPMLPKEIFNVSVPPSSNKKIAILFFCSISSSWQNQTRLFLREGEAQALSI